MDDGVLEVHGVQPSSTNYVRAREKGDGRVEVEASSTGGVTISPAEARYLGLKLLRLARRIEARAA